jgi:hypothetical protein
MDEGPVAQAQRLLRHASNGRRTLRLTAKMLDGELLDAGEDIERLLVDCDVLDLSPGARDLLFALDEAIAAAVARRR